MSRQTACVVCVNKLYIVGKCKRRVILTFLLNHVTQQQAGITVTLGGQEGLPSLMTNLSLDSQKAPEHGQKR